MAEPLIGSKTKGFQMSRGGIRVKFPSTTSSTSSTSINNLIPLSTQLAFTRGEIPGSTYKDIVDQAIATVSPGTAIYNTLLKEESQAIAKADTEGKALRRLQAQAKAASSPGKTVQDAVDLYNFWLNEYNNYSATDPEYALQALTNAGNARDQAETRAKSATSGASTWKGSDATAFTESIQTNSFVYKQALRKIEDGFQKSLIDGQTRDTLIAELASSYSVEVSNKLNDLLTIKSQGIEKIGGTDIDTLISQQDNLLNGTIDNTGKVSGGLLNVVSDFSRQIADQGKYIDIITPKGIVRQLKDASKMYLTDEYGRSVEITKTKDAGGGKVIAEADFPDPNNPNKVIHVASYPFDPTKETPVFHDQWNRVLNELNTLGDKGVGRFNVFGMDKNPTFLKDYLGAQDEWIKAYKPKDEYLTQQQFAEKTHPSVTQQIMKAVSNIPKVQLTPPAPSAPSLASNIQLYKTPTGENLAQPIAMPKPITGQGQFPISLPTPSPTITQYPKSATMTTGGQIAGPTTPINVGNLGLAPAPSTYNFPKATTSAPAPAVWSMQPGHIDYALNLLKGIGNKDPYVDINEYNNALNQMQQKGFTQPQATQVLNTAMTQGGLKKYKW